MLLEAKNAKHQRLLRLKQEEKENEKPESDQSISNFSFQYKHPSKGIGNQRSNEQVEEDDREGGFSIAFNHSDEEKDDLNNPDGIAEQGGHKSRSHRKNKASQSLYDALTDKVRNRLGDVEALIQGGEEEVLDLEVLDKALKDIRFVMKSPVYEFGDFEHLKNYSLPLARLGASARSGAIVVAQGNKIAFNNLTAAVTLTLDLLSHAPLFKPVFKLRNTDLISCMARGSDRYSDILLVSTIHTSAVAFLNTGQESPEVMFRVPFDETDEGAKVAGMMTNGNRLAIVQDNFKVQVIDIETNSTVSKMCLLEANQVQDDLVQDVVSQGSMMFVVTLKKLFMIKAADLTVQVVSV